MTIGNRIAKTRKAKGFTQEYLAESLGVSRQAVSKWEKDQTAPDTKNLIALASLLGVSVEYLASGTRETVSQTPESKAPGILLRAGAALFALALIVYGVGVFSGEFMYMVSVPISGSMEVGIPFLYYGRSTLAYFLLAAAGALLVVLGVKLGKK